MTSLSLVVASCLPDSFLVRIPSASDTTADINSVNDEELEVVCDSSEAEGDPWMLWQELSWCTGHGRIDCIGKS